MLPAVQSYQVVLFIHILAVAAGIGPTLAYPVFVATAERIDPRSVPGVLRAIEARDRLSPLFILMLIASGIHMVIDRWSFGDFYVIWGLSALAITFAIVVTYFVPRTKQMLELAERDIGAAGAGEAQPSAEYRKVARARRRVEYAVGALMVVTIFAMTTKPF